MTTPNLGLPTTGFDDSFERVHFAGKFKRRRDGEWSVLNEAMNERDILFLQVGNLQCTPLTRQWEPGEGRRMKGNLTFEFRAEDSG